MRNEFTKKDLLPFEMSASVKQDKKDMLGVIIQAFYGNRVFTRIDRADIDMYIMGCLDREFFLPSEREKIDRTIVRIPGTENLVMVYNNNQEQEAINDKEELFAKEGYVSKPLAEIPELGLKLYSRCIVCRMDENGELQSLEEGDGEKFMKYLAE